MNIPDNQTGHQYCQEHGLRILAGDAFKYFWNHLADIPGNYLEMGVFEGYMLRALADRFQDRMFYGIDPFIEDGNTSGHNDGVQKGETTWKQMVQAHSNLDHVRNVTLFQQTSRQWAALIPYENLHAMEIGAVFVDGDHSYEEALNDMIIGAQALSRGGVMYVDDIGLPSVAKAAGEFAVTEHERLVNYEFGQPVMHLRPL